MKSDEELTKRYRQKVYVGRSRREGRKQPSLEAAIKNAYRQAAADTKAKAGGITPEADIEYRVLDIWAVGKNPLSDYIVALKAGG
jgi:hypothetical protein